MFTRNLFLFVLALGISGGIFIYVFVSTILQQRKANSKLNLNNPAIIIAVIALLAGIFELLVALYFVRDVPLYLRKEYKVVRGVPSEIIYQEGSGRVSSRLSVEIEGETFNLPPRFADTIQKNKDKPMEIKYLPITKWYVEMKSDDQLLQ